MLALLEYTGRDPAMKHGTRAARIRSARRGRVRRPETRFAKSGEAHIAYQWWGPVLPISSTCRAGSRMSS